MPIPIASNLSSVEGDSTSSEREQQLKWHGQGHTTILPFHQHSEELNNSQSEDSVRNKLLKSVANDREETIQRMKATQRSLLPAAEFRDHSVHDESSRKSLSPIPDVAEIERPRSALHSGDFRESQAATSKHKNAHLLEPEQSSPPRFWYAQPFAFGPQQHYASVSRETPTRSRAPSVGSLSSSFVYRPPTSPLVQQSNNSELDIPDDGFSGLGTNLDKSARRRTLPPESFRSFESSSPPQGQPPNFSRPISYMKREHSLPYQAHQPRRSISSMHSFQAPSNSQTPLNRSRRPSLSSDISPLHASMVGSFEESILRGRMSTTPSKPLDFVAKIGVLGKGNCRPKLRCPPHVTVPFPAVFYSYPELTGRRSVADDSPSPYVGSIDLENNLKPPPRPKKARVSPTRDGYDGDVDMQDIIVQDGASITQDGERRKRGKKTRRSRSPQLPLGGCYRLPQEGQLQIVIKNPNNTAVKLFLVPYNLEGMEPGTKTFIRQRSYSAGPMIEPSIGSRSSTGPPKTEGKPVLRYLIHLMICCPYKGRFYLYDNIRVVFANRVPDGKEKLRNEVQFPDPRYTPYKPGRDTPSSSAGAKLTADLARRRSSGYNIPLYQDMHTDTSMADASHPHFAVPFSLPTKVQNSDASPLPRTSSSKTPSPGHFWAASFASNSAPDSDNTVSTPTPPIRQVGFHPSSSPAAAQFDDLSGEPWRRQPQQRSGQQSGRNTPEAVPGGYGKGESSLLARKLKGLDRDRDVDLSRDDWHGMGSQEMQ